MNRQEQIQQEAGNYSLDLQKTKSYGYMSAVRAREAFISGAQFADSSRWVKVEDSLPKSLPQSFLSEMVLAYDPNYELPMLSYYDHSNNEWENPDAGNWHPTYWQPLPEAPTTK